MIQISYQLSGRVELFDVATNIHTCSTFATILLQIYLAFVLAKLSQQGDSKVRNEVLQRDVTVHA